MSADGPSMHLSDRRLHFLQFYLLFLLSITQFGLVDVVDRQLVVVILFYVLVLIDVFELHEHVSFQPFFVNQPDVPKFFFSTRRVDGRPRNSDYNTCAVTGKTSSLA